LKQFWAKPQINFQCTCKLCKPASTIRPITAGVVGLLWRLWPMLKRQWMTQHLWKYVNIRILSCSH